MRKKCLIQALGVVFLAVLVQPALFAQSTDVDQRIADLQKQVEALRAELTALKPKPAEASPATAEMHAAPATATSTDAAKPDALAGISKVLGGATFTGWVDTFYNVNFDQPASHQTGFRSWDGSNSAFTLNSVNLTLDKAPSADERFGYHAALLFGQQASTIAKAEPLASTRGTGWDQNILEAYLSYLAPLGKGLQIDAGKFVTPTGAEVVPTKDNWNYTRGLLYDYAIPIYHFGVRAKYAFNDKVSLTGFVLNGWNNVVDNNSGKTGAVMLGWNPTKKLSITQNYMFGPEQSDVFAGGSAGADSHWRNLSDTTVAYTLTPKLTVQTNVDYGHDTVGAAKQGVYWFGAANYLRYVFNPKYSATVRHEYYLDHDGFTTGTAQHMHEITGTLEKKVAGHFISRLEYRHDMSNRPVFFEHSADAPTLKSQNTFTVGVIYTLEKSE